MLSINNESFFIKELRRIGSDQSCYSGIFAHLLNVLRKSIIIIVLSMEKEESFDQDLDSLLQSLEELQAETEVAQLESHKSEIHGDEETEDDALKSLSDIEKRQDQSDIKQDQISSNRHSSISLNYDIQELQATTTQLIKDQLEGFQTKLDAKELAQAEEEMRVREEKICVALDKIKEANVKKRIVKIYSANESSKTILISDKMTAGEICLIMMEKCHVKPDPSWVLVEHLTEQNLERNIEDHQIVVDIVSLWPVNSNNKLYFLLKSNKYALFKNPQHYLLASGSDKAAEKSAEKDKERLLNEFFSNNQRVPDVDGPLYIRSGKKSWKKYHCVLRVSGLYVSQSKSKSLLGSSRNLQCLIKFESYTPFIGLKHRELYNAPTEFCICLWPNEKKKTVIRFCTEDLSSMKLWYTGVRIALYGNKMYNNYKNMKNEIEKLAPELASLSNWDSNTLSAAHKGMSKGKNQQNNKVQSKVDNRQPGTENTGTKAIADKAKYFIELFLNSWNVGSDLLAKQSADLQKQSSIKKAAKQSQESSTNSKLAILKQDLQFENALSKLRQRNSEKKEKSETIEGLVKSQSRTKSIKKLDRNLSVKLSGMPIKNTVESEATQQDLDDLYVMPVKRYNSQTDKPSVAESHIAGEGEDLLDLPPPPTSAVITLDELYAPPPQIDRQKLITTNVDDQGKETVVLRKKSLRGLPPKPPPRMD
ncbi:Amyloid beta A4 precursor protein-binding family B member 1-interacting protein [Trichoplax sp. H2]|nr:Amyloid beta A4 precursor protein-binding family B member 1-interacting protein [Trichoplax sp. H2]|eukprot:RDD42811.1 Amyloid beta A4 precursor protein-binding family B member 1-interacting protein [Trichoplax sp. H2]